MNNAAKTKYYLFIDECGDQNLENFNPVFPIFTLCGILVSRENINRLEYQFKLLKQEFWESEDVIIHSRDIRRCKNEFINLLDTDTKERFYQQVNEILKQNGIYIIVACSILKEPFIKHFSSNEDVYGLSLSYLIERSIFCVDDTGIESTIDIIFEKRGKNEDRMLTKYYNGLRVTGTKWVKPDRLCQRISAFTSKAKKDNIIGLQIADLIAYPIARKVLNPKMPNPAFDIIEPNIYSSNGVMLGFKTIPH